MTVEEWYQRSRYVSIWSTWDHAYVPALITKIGDTYCVKFLGSYVKLNAYDRIIGRGNTARFFGLNLIL